MGIDRKVLPKLAECGLIPCSRPSLKITWYYPAEIEEFVERTRQDADFWNTVRRKAFLTGEDLRR
jgi:hypothetical protein